jgi:hypothetical protein
MPLRYKIKAKLGKCAARSGSLENERAWNSPRNANVQEKYTGTPTLRADSSFALLRGQESGHERDEGSGQPKQFGGMGRSWLKHGLQGLAILGAGLKMTGPHCARVPETPPLPRTRAGFSF